MRNLIKKILKEGFISEKAAPRKRFRKEPEEEVGPEKKKDWIYAITTDENGKTKIIWTDEIDKLETLMKDVKKLEDSIKRNKDNTSRFHPQFRHRVIKHIKDSEEELEIKKQELADYQDYITGLTVNLFN